VIFLPLALATLDPLAACAYADARARSDVSPSLRTTLALVAVVNTFRGEVPSQSGNRMETSSVSSDATIAVNV
jgi:hypothetical protein